MYTDVKVNAIHSAQIMYFTFIFENVALVEWEKKEIMQFFKVCHWKIGSFTRSSLFSLAFLYFAASSNAVKTALSINGDTL